MMQGSPKLELSGPRSWSSVIITIITIIALAFTFASDHGTTVTITIITTIIITAASIDVLQGIRC
jgi:hypothetical protein